MCALLGSEGTCALTLEATLQLIESPLGRALLVLGYPDVYSSADHVPEIMDHHPNGLEGIDHRLVGYMERKGLNVSDLDLLPDGRGWLLVEFGGGDRAAAQGRAREVMEFLRKGDHPPSMKLYTSTADEQKVWEVRESGLGTDFNPATPETHFSFSEDIHSFSHATRRCVGVGKCRREGGGTMCPSYMVTHEEKHSTRGRAHLLVEMLEGDVITDGWRNESVKEALDLCLACKGCKGDCPVNVDMATYKAEFSRFTLLERSANEAHMPLDSSCTGYG